MLPILEVLMDKPGFQFADRSSDKQRSWTSMSWPDEEPNNVSKLALPGETTGPRVGKSSKTKRRPESEMPCNEECIFSITPADPA